VSTLCVVGAGPAGSIFAARMAQLGHDVWLVERQPFPRPHLGESLSPGVLPLLDMIGARERVAAQGRRVRKVIVKWGTAAVVREDPREQGLIVDRGDFDRLLLERAKALGVRILQPAVVRAQSGGAGGWDLSIETPGRTVRLQADFLADARGRAGGGSGSRRRTAGRTLALYAYWRGADLPGQPRIEAGEAAWYWGVPLPDGTYNTLVFVDAKGFRGECPAASGAASGAAPLAARFLALLRRSDIMAGCRDAQMVGTVSAIDATPYVDESCATPTLLKVGDSALAIDPLSSSGVQKAVQGALSAAIVANTLLRRRSNADAALAFYRSSLAEASDRHCRWAAGHYEKIVTEGGGRFWQDRAIGPAKPPAAPSRKPLDAAALSVTEVGLSRHLEFVDLPCIDGDFVALKPAVRHPGLDGPVAYLGGQEIALLLRGLPAGSTPLEIARSWADKMPLDSGLAIAGWMLNRGILVAQGFGPRKGEQ
jgi:flavin-dependent dehydrogenase